MGTPRHVDFSKLNLPRLAHNFLQQTKGGNYNIDDLNFLNQYVDYVLSGEEQKKFKIGVMFVCINQIYWQYAVDVLQGAQNLLLPGHDVDFLVWSDVPENNSKEEEKLLEQFKIRDDVKTLEDGMSREDAKTFLDTFWSTKNLTVFPTDSIEWPYPTLMRYHLFLGQEEKLKEYDYLFYIDLDMRFVNVVGDEILGDGLTAAQHPMYALPQNLWLPYEANPASTAYVRQPGKLLERNGKPLFMPLYAAGGIQGGTRDSFIEAMKSMKIAIDEDFSRNYVARWNDESHWNRYLNDHPPSVILSPSYVYPDSMIEEYYVKKVWGCNYPPKIITITKPFTVSKEGGEAARKLIES